MKLLRVGPAGAEKPALLDSTGVLRDISSLVKDIDGEALSPGNLIRLAALDATGLPQVSGSPRIGPCVVRPLNFICIGLNYADHAAETGAKIPNEPIVFLKSLGAYQGPNDDVKIPRGSKKTDWEVELGVVIGTRASYVSESAAMDYVAGYCLCNDVERARVSERARRALGTRERVATRFGPTGPWLVTKDEVPDPQNLDMWLDVDGKRMQTGNTRTMIFGVQKLVSYVSHFMTLHPGDIISTGTPAGRRAWDQAGAGVSEGRPDDAPGDCRAG